MGLITSLGVQIVYLLLLDKYAISYQTTCKPAVSIIYLKKIKKNEIHVFDFEGAID